MVKLNQKEGSRILYAEIGERLRKADYEEFLQTVEPMIEQHGTIRILVEMRDFHGWTAGALWEDIKFDAKHFADIERLALVGDKQWQKGMAIFSKPFTAAAIRYFDATEINEAKTWVEEGS